MLTVNLKYVILDWQEWHSMMLLQLFSGRYAEFARRDSYSTLLAELIHFKHTSCHLNSYSVLLLF
jgi:hypothetical protein